MTGESDEDASGGGSGAGRGNVNNDRHTAAQYVFNNVARRLDKPARCVQEHNKTLRLLFCSVFNGAANEACRNGRDRFVLQAYCQDNGLRTRRFQLSGVLPERRR